MSFNVYTRITTDTTDVAGAIIAEAASQIATQRDQGTGAEAEAAIAAGANAAARAVEAIGTNFAEASVMVSGHVNPGHEARGGWSNDFLNVQISVLKYKSQVAAEEALAAEQAAAESPNEPAPEVAAPAEAATEVAAGEADPA